MAKQQSANSKQTKILKGILNSFEQLEALDNNTAYNFHSDFIRLTFKKSLNKKDIVRRLLNEVVLTNDQIVYLLRIIYKGKKNEN